MATAPSSSAVPVGASRFAALGVPTFRWYWLAGAVSTTGDGMENVIRNWLVLQLTGSPFWLGMMVFAHWVPFTFFSFYGGVLADRHDNRRVQLLAQALLLLAAAAVAAVTLAGRVTVWWLFGLLLLHGFAGAIGGPAQQTLIHAMVGRDKLLSAVSLNSSIRQLSQVIGPVIAAFILAAFGPGWGFLVNAVTFVPLLILLLLIRVPRLGDRSEQSVRESFAEGVAFVRARPTLGALIAIEMLPVIFLGHAFSSLIPVFVRDVLHGDELTYGFLLAASGVGALVAAAAIAYAPPIRRKGVFIIVASMVEMLAILVFALSTDYWLSLGLMVAIGGASVLAQSLNNSTIQLSVPDSIRGRVMGAYTFGTQGLRLVNGPLLGTAALIIGTPVAVAGSAVLVLAGLGAILLKVPLVRVRD
ncbi:MAG: MFS transporter [Chloroflexota bacterium]|nr:MFS transporter [Chloroflexota bacterium]